MRWRTRVKLAAGIIMVSLIVGTASPAIASAPDLFGYGARGSAMAGTLTATASGHEAVYYNPAALAFAERASFSLGYQWAGFVLEIDGESIDVDSAPALVIGFDVPLPFRGALADRLTLGFGFVLPQSTILVADIPHPGTPRFVRLETRAQTVTLMGALGVRLFEDLAIGAGFIALSELRGAIDVAPNDARRIGTTVKDELVADYAPVLGVIYRPLEALSLGLVFRGESAADFSLPITAELGDRFPIVIPRLDVSGTAQYDPPELAVAASLGATDELLVSAAIVYEAWSRFENPIVFTAVPSDFPAQPDPNFSDVVTARAGAELNLRLDGWNLLPRAGLAFSPSPVPEQTGFHNYLDNSRIIVAAGTGVRAYSFRIDLALQWHILPERTNIKDPALADQVPPFIPPMSSAPPPRPGFPEISHAGSVFAFSVELGIEL